MINLRFVTIRKLLFLTICPLVLIYIQSGWLIFNYCNQRTKQKVMVIYVGGERRLTHSLILGLVYRNTNILGGLVKR